MNRKLVPVIAGIHLIFTCFTDPLVFTEPWQQHVGIYIFLKAVLFAVLLGLWNGIYEIFIEKNIFLRKIVLYALPYFVLLLGYMFYTHPMEFYGDERVIYQAAAAFDIIPAHFTYITGTTYAIALMLLPFKMGVVVFKLLLQSFACGYCICKVNSWTQKKAGIAMYLVFLLPGVITNSLLIHRMQFYGVLYLVVAVKLLADYSKKIKNTGMTLLLLMIAMDVLTIWRKEGIYLLLLGPLLICAANRITDKKLILRQVGVFLLVFAIVYLPEVVIGGMDVTEDTHTYNQWFVNMCGEGLDQDKYALQIEQIDKVLSIDAVNRINEDLGDENYMEEYIAWRDGYVGVKSGYTQEELENFKSAVRYIVLHEPGLFLKTVWKRWNYSSNAGDFHTVRGWARFLLKNLYIPFLAVIISFFAGIRKKNWLLALLALGIMMHCAATVLFAPVAYFKYYYHMYLIGNFLIVIYVIYWFDRQRKRTQGV
jgi:hypothetical protein